MYDLSGKVALVTGGARGIGRAIGLRLAAEGADLAVADVNLEGVEAVAAEARSLGRRAAALQVDVTSPAQAESMVQRVVADFGGLDICVANAGVISMAPLLSMAESDWDRIFDVNVKGVWLTTAVAGRQMVRQGRGGRIILAASRAGKTPSRMHNTGAYSASKHAVVGYTRALAFELAKHQITVNAYCPGMVDTDMWAAIDADYSEREGVPPGTLRAQAMAQIPLGRIEQPDDVANLVAWLASDQASYVTAQAINVEGGTEVH